MIYGNMVKKTQLMGPTHYECLQCHQKLKSVGLVVELTMHDWIALCGPCCTQLGKAVEESESPRFIAFKCDLWSLEVSLDAQRTTTKPTA